MKLGILIAGMMMLAGASMLAPAASADQRVCTPDNNTCAQTYSRDRNVCATDSNAYQYRQAGVTRRDGAQNTQVGVYNYCSAYEWGGRHSYSSLGVYYYSYNTQTWDSKYTSVEWYGSEGPNYSYCSSAAYSYNNAPVPNGRQDLPLCSVKGQPGMIIPTLP